MARLTSFQSYGVKAPLQWFIQSIILQPMKNMMLRYNRKMLLVTAVLFSGFLLGGATQAQARDGNHDRGGDGNYHHYGNYDHHRGHWNQQSGTAVWINVG
jgi:hypothetical protein